MFKRCLSIFDVCVLTLSVSAICFAFSLSFEMKAFLTAAAIQGLGYLRLICAYLERKLNELESPQW